MKLKNKRTGEIVDLLEGDLRGVRCGEQIVVKPVAALGKEYVYNSLAELCEEWEDYEEPKEFWHITCEGKVTRVPYSEYCHYPEREIGNHFETEEEGKLAVNKLRALTRLENNGFKFKGWTIDDGLRVSICTNVDGKGIYDDGKKELRQNLDLLFGGEE